MKIYDKWKVKSILFKNRLTLYFLLKAMIAYRKQSKILIGNIPKENLWVSGIETDEKVLDQAQKIVNRRLKNLLKK
jgi:hypothetical protein